MIGCSIIFNESEQSTLKFVYEICAKIGPFIQKHWNHAVWLVKTSHATFNCQQECFISGYLCSPKICLWHWLQDWPIFTKGLFEACYWSAVRLVPVFAIFKHSSSSSTTTTTTSSARTFLAHVIENEAELLKPPQFVLNWICQLECV